MTDEFDEMLRSRLQQPEPAATSDAHVVLGHLQPAMRRARIRRTVAIGTATLSLLGLSGVGLAAVTSSLRQEPSDVDILREVDTSPEPAPQISATAPTDSEDTRDDHVDDEQTATPPTNLPTTTSITVETIVPATTSPRAPNSAPARPDGGETTPVTTTVAVAQPTTPTAPTTTPPTTPPTTAPASFGQRTIASNCGSINVSSSGNSISLTGTQPAAGYTVDIKNSGPSEVEVGFTNGDGECEVTAWVESGELRTDVENHESDDDDDDDGEDEDDVGDDGEDDGDGGVGEDEDDVGDDGEDED